MSWSSNGYQMGWVCWGSPTLCFLLMPASQVLVRGSGDRKHRSFLTWQLQHASLSPRATDLALGPHAQCGETVDGSSLPSSTPRHWQSLKVYLPRAQEVGTHKQQSPLQSQQRCWPHCICLRVHPKAWAPTGSTSHTAREVGAPSKGVCWSWPQPLPGLCQQCTLPALALHCSMSTKRGNQQISKNTTLVLPPCDIR